MWYNVGDGTVVTENLACPPYGDPLAANPFRYRGYYYDNESGFYYLQTRYYDPEIGRFINADVLSYLGAALIVAGVAIIAVTGGTAAPALVAAAATTFTFGNGANYSYGWDYYFDPVSMEW